MIKFENTQVMGWEAAIRGMRNPMNSWEKSDTEWHTHFGDDRILTTDRKFMSDSELIIGPNDLDLMRRLAAGGPVHAKYRRMIAVYVDIIAPLYWWKEFDTYKIGTVANSCSTMHKIAAKKFTLEDFSCEHLCPSARSNLGDTIHLLNCYRHIYNNWDDLKDNTAPGLWNITSKKDAWWQMIQLLPSSYNQKRTVMMNYEVLAHIWNDRRNHKLDEWSEHSVGLTKGGLGARGPIETKQKYVGFCDWIRTLPHAELITGEKGDSKE